jgi:DNA-directed RNA polymerase specialized sigma24 family protein
MASHEASADLLHPELRQHLAAYLRRRLPPAEVDDALQAVYCAALEARNIPSDHVHLRRWLTVIARRQVAAYYERSSAEQLGEAPEVEVQPELVEAMSMLRWAEREAAHSQLESVDQTLDWMARESDGEKLEAIAADTQMPSARIRQRVSRLRRFMKARWMLEMSAALVLIAITSWMLTRREQPVVKLERVPRLPMTIMLPDPMKRAVELREEALRHCDEYRFRECLRLLDEAAGIDPQGDEDLEIVGARKRALEQIAPPPPMPTTTSTVKKPLVAPTTTSRGTPSSPFSSSGTL